MPQGESSEIPDQRATMVMVLHHHQPVGNFPEVFQDTFDKCYRPTLELLAAFPEIHASIHLTGPLWVWAEKNAPDYLDLLVRLEARRQIEVIGGGFYEPILAMLPERDAWAQVEEMNRMLRRRFGHASKGFWLAERVWQTDLPARLAPMGLEYLPVDDHHFILSGIPAEKLHGYYRSSWIGRGLDLFPISRDLRYLIPFQLPEQFLDYMDRNGKGGKVLTYADDAEKFGVWPETHHWVWEEGYLRNLFEQIVRQSDWLRVASMEEIVAERAPTGVAVLPNASYEEMMEWALPAHMGVRFNQTGKDLEQRGLKQLVQPFFRGGIFENFLIKYPDISRLYGRMLFTSALLPDKTEENGEHWLKWSDLLSRAQGNDVYWHGLFGGIYLSNLRHEAYSDLLQAETLLEQDGVLKIPSLHHGDFDQDGRPDVMVFRQSYSLWATPALGGSIPELDDRVHHFHLTNTMTRQFETYHARIGEKQNESTHESGVISSIHDRPLGDVAQSEIVYDPRPRRAFSDGIVPSSVTGDDLDRGKNLACDLSDAVFSVRSSSPGGLELQSVFQLADAQFLIKKDFRFEDRQFVVRYRLCRPDGQAFPEACDSLFWVTEIPLTLLAGEGQGRYLRLMGGSDPSPFLWETPSDFEGVMGYSGSDDWSKAEFSIIGSNLFRLVSRPIHTISLSEKGIEKTYQGTVFFHLFPMSSLSGDGMTITVSISGAVREGR
ncbi:MAG: alpha-amylase/4-alpha-glucanotransferase domain-containing protein [Leptospirales bacterium]